MIRSKVPSQEYKDNWDKVFGKSEQNPEDYRSTYIELRVDTNMTEDEALRMFRTAFRDFKNGD